VRTSAIEKRTGGLGGGWSIWGLMGAFTVGASAGLATAPFQVSHFSSSFFFLFVVLSAFFPPLSLTV
jgi:hypothetical protein